LLSVENVGHETGRFDAKRPAVLHALLDTSKNRRGEDVLGTLLPGGDGTTRFGLLAEDEPNEHVQTAEREEEEGGNEGEAVDVMGKNRGPNQALNNSESADAEIITKDWEKLVEKRRGPSDFGEEEDDDLSDDQKTVENGPEDAGWLVGNGRIGDVIVTEGRGAVRRERVRTIGIVLVGVKSLNVLNEGHDAARKDEDEGDNAQSPDDVQPNEHVSSGWKHDGR